MGDQKNEMHDKTDELRRIVDEVFDYLKEYYDLCRELYVKQSGEKDRESIENQKEKNIEITKERRNLSRILSNMDDIFRLLRKYFPENDSYNINTLKLAALFSELGGLISPLYPNYIGYGLLMKKLTLAEVLTVPVGAVSDVLLYIDTNEARMKALTFSRSYSGLIEEVKLDKFKVDAEKKEYTVFAESMKPILVFQHIYYKKSYKEIRKWLKDQYEIPDEMIDDLFHVFRVEYKATEIEKGKMELADKIKKTVDQLYTLYSDNTNKIMRIAETVREGGVLNKRYKPSTVEGGILYFSQKNLGLAQFVDSSLEHYMEHFPGKIVPGEHDTYTEFLDILSTQFAFSYIPNMVWFNIFTKNVFSKEIPDREFFSSKIGLFDKSSFNQFVTNVLDVVLDEKISCKDEDAAAIARFRIMDGLSYDEDDTKNLVTVNKQTSQNGKDKDEVKEKTKEKIKEDTKEDNKENTKEDNKENKNDSNKNMEKKKNVKLSRRDIEEILHYSLKDLDKTILEHGSVINKNNLEKLSAYITSRVLVNNDNNNDKDSKIYDIHNYPYNNLMIIVDKEEYDFVIPRYIGDMVAPEDTKTTFIDAEYFYKLLYVYKNKKSILDVDYTKETKELVEDIINEPDTLIVEDFKRHPIIDEDLGTGKALQANRDSVDCYDDGMKYFSECIRKNPLKNYIIVTDRRVFNDYKQDHEIYYRTFRYHVFLDPLDVDMVVDACLKFFDGNLRYSVSKDYKQELEKYVRAVYPVADLRGKRFIDDLKNRILSAYYSKIRYDKVITPEFIPGYKNIDIDSIFESLKDIIGMDNVKEELRSLYKDRVVSDKISKTSKKKKNNLHMIFTGNPGTGKTTIAQKIADMYFAMGITKTNKLVSVKVGDLVSLFQGGTTNKALSVIERAYGGVLFIDEAYGFINGAEKEQKALEVLIQEMENNRDNLVVIMAGYPNEMKELMKMNPGLKSRIGKTIHFEDYSENELVEIFKVMCRAEGFEFEEDAIPVLQECIMAKKSGRFFGNAREVRNIFEAASRQWSNDVFDASQSEEKDISEYSRVIGVKHLEKLLPEKRQDAVVADNLVGLDSIKKKLEQFKNQVIYKKFIKERGMSIPDFNMHMIFMGNPGTGKTTVAKMIADDLYSAGVLKTNHVSVKERRDLVAGYVGQTAPKTREVIEDARGGVLFIDEAYSLTSSKESQNDFGAEAIDTLIVAMEEFKEDTIFIFAGYTDQMHEFIESNPGIKSRIGYTFTFDDYSVDQLMQIYNAKMDASGFVTEDAAKKKVRDIMEYFKDSRDFGNGRFVEHVIQQIINKRGDRFSKNKDVKNYSLIIEEDIPTVAEILETSSDKMRLHDPGKLSKDSKRRTAVHELGHAIAQYVLDKNYPPKVVSVKSHAGSLGRMEMTEKEYDDNMDEKDLRNHIVTLLAGRNAERMIFGCNSSGVSDDYRRAKNAAKSMIEDYAMGEIGVTTDMDILKAEDARCVELLEEHKDILLGMVDYLLENEEILKDDFVRLFEEIKDKNSTNENNNKTKK